MPRGSLSTGSLSIPRRNRTATAPAPRTGRRWPGDRASLPGKFGTIKRSDGSTQATYDGHPLYTYKGDSAAGQTGGNGLKLSGGLWYAVTPSGAKPASSPPPHKSSGGGGGY